MGKKKKQRLKRKRRITFLVILLILSGLVVFLLTGECFKLKTVTVEGNSYVSSEEIAEGFGLTPGTHLVRYCLKHLFRTEEMSLKLTAADIYFHWPDAVSISVEEENFVGYLYFQGTYLCLNRQGIVIDSTEEKKYNIPEILGVSVGSFSLGKVPVTENNEPFTAVMEIATVLNKYGLSEKVGSINVRHLEDIILYTEQLEVRCGSCEEIDYKVAVLEAFLDQYPNATGILHLEDTDAQVYLENAN